MKIPILAFGQLLQFCSLGILDVGTYNKRLTIAWL